VSFDFLSREGRAAVVAAQRLARTRDEEAVELEHLLHALSEAPGSAQVLEQAGADLARLRARLDQALRELPKAPGAKVYLGERVLRLLDIAQVEARERGEDSVSPLHMLLGIPLETRSAAAEVLRELGVTLTTLERALPAATGAGAPALPPGDGRGTDGAGRGNGAGGTRAQAGSANDARAEAAATAGVGPAEATGEIGPLLKKFARDLTALAAAGGLDPVVGRDEETRRIMQILGRRGKSNPILIGDPGVGKTAVVEGLASRIAAGDVPAGLADKRILALDVGALVAGAKFRGEFEDRVRGLLREVREAGGRALLFFDEIHTLVGAGQGDGNLDAADLLKPALARGELSCIGATSIDEYRLHIEKDPAFERRFLPVLIEEPGEELGIAMLRGIKRRYEDKHRVRVQDAALVAAVKLSRRYVSGRSLPDKAIDLLDEAGSRLRLELDSHPDEVDVLARRERALALELEALERSRDPDAGERRHRLATALAELRAQLSPMREKWQAELAAISTLTDSLQALGEARVQADAAERAGDLARAAEIRFGQLPALEKAAAEAETTLRKVQGAERLLEDAVEPVHVARVVADWTGIPVARMLEGERQKILGIEARLRERVLGQDEAVRLVGQAVKRARAGLADPGRPIGSFLFLGPTGVGKTELSKALAEFLFDDEHALIRLDMSEYMDKHTVARLSGAPPGYVGYEEGGQLTEAVHRRPYSVVLFDEVEKAHPDVWNVLLAVLDDGRLTDSRGRTVRFDNTVLILTSNLAGPAILAAAGDREAIRREVKAALQGHFRPEFLNRIDETVIFNPLGTAEIAAIVDLQLRRLHTVLAEQKLTLEVTPEARALLARESYEPAFGARPVKRCLQRRLRDPLAEHILAGKFAPGDHIRVTATSDTLLFEKTAPPAAR
jgi:ATP-dependent Clp protease ATP-binding subunit ClpB